jgi:tetratricopeptide (TPR) repeat protein
MIARAACQQSHGAYMRCLTEAARIGLGLAVSILAISSALADSGAEELAACQREDDPAARVRLCTKVIENTSEIDEIRAEALLNRGLAQAAGQLLVNAIADYTAAIELNPEYGALYQSRGEAYFRMGEAAKAIADFTAAIKLDPRNALALNSRAAVYMHIDDLGAALADFESPRMQTRSRGAGSSMSARVTWTAPPATIARLWRSKAATISPQRASSACAAPCDLPKGKRPSLRLTSRVLPEKWEPVFR